MQQIHPEVSALLADIEAVVGGPRLSQAAMGKWALRLASHADAARIGDELVVISIRFAREGGWLAAKQMFNLASLSMPRERLQAGLDAAGLASEDARKLMDSAKGEAAALGKGLAAPAAGAGAGLRAKK